MRRFLFLVWIVGSAVGCRGQQFCRQQVPDVSCQPVSTTCPMIPPTPARNQTVPAVTPGPQPARPAPGSPPAALPSTLQGLKAPTVREIRGAEESSDALAQASAAAPAVVLVPRTVYVPYTPYPPAMPAKLPPVVPVTHGVAHLPEMPDGPKDGGAAVPETQLTETLGQCLHQMRMLNARIADLETKLAARPASYSAPVAGDTPATPIAPPLTPPAAIAPAGTFPRSAAPIPATLSPRTR